MNFQFSNFELNMNLNKFTQKSVEALNAAQQMEHPLKRVMRVFETEGAVEVTFTDIHLPRTVGEAIERAYDGELDIQYAEESGIARVYWSRND